MPIVYNPCAGTQVPAHHCNACTDPEMGGVRGTAFIQKDYMKLTTDGSIDPEVATEAYWETGITSGKIHVIGETSGTFDGGTPKTGKGRGDVKERTLGKDFVLNFSDYDHKDNENFWAAMEKAAGEYYVAWRTDTEFRIEEDTESEVAWNAEVKWFQKKGTVKVFDLAPVKKFFSCFSVTP